MVLDGIHRHLDIAAHADELRWAIRAGRTPRLRSYRKFAEDEIVLPNTGPKGGRKFRCEYQPFSALWFDAIGSGLFNRFAASGPSQSGKTLDCFVIPMMYHLFEKRENVIGFAPNMEICEDKFLIDVLPIIQKSRFAEHLPKRGGGSQGGFDELIRFGNGTYLKWMTGGGGDKNKAAITAKVGCGTEVDGMAEGVATSVESSPLNQIAARLRAHGSRALMFLECTVSTPEGIINQEIQNGTASRIVMPCAHCFHWVSPEREHFLGWDGAATELEAETKGRFFCPDCGTAWSPEQRRAANHRSKLVHRGQEITPDGTIVGPVPETRTLGFRWSAVNNLFAEESQLGAEEWKARRDPDAESAERERCQFVWCIPVKIGAQDVVELTAQALLERTHSLERRVVPPGCEVLTVGLDLGGSRCYWSVMAWGEHGRGYVIDYGWLHVPQAMLGLETGLVEAQRQFRDLCAGSQWQRADGLVLTPSVACVDSGWQTTTAYKFIQETGLPFYATKGLPVGGQNVSYNRPKSTGAIVKWIGDGWHIARLKEDDIELLEIDADYAKTTLHSRLACDLKAPGAITMFAVDRKNKEATEERYRFVRHLTAEKATEEFIPERGTITHWTKTRPDNHWLDSTALALMGGNVAGVQVIELASSDSSSVAEVPRATETASKFVRQPRQGGWLRRRS